MKKYTLPYTMTAAVLALVISLSVFPASAYAGETVPTEKTEAVTQAKETPSAKTTAVTGIKLDKKSVSMKAGDTLSLTASVLPKNASNQNVKWKSSNKEVAVVSAGGKITALTYGTAKITAVTEDGKFKASCKVKVLFSDLGDASDDFYEPIYWAADNKIVDTTSGKDFKPEAKCKREDAILYLYNLLGKPDHKKKTTFKDIPQTSIFYDAVSWAQEKGLLKKIAKKKTFGLGTVCTKEEFVTYLYRIKEEPYVGYDGRFEDVKAKSYYKDAVNWAVENNVADGLRNTDGTSRFEFGTGTELTREEALILLYNYVNIKEIPDNFGYPSYAFPVLRNGDEVTEEIYQKYTNPEYCAEVFAYYALQQGWQYEAVVGALAFMWAEGLSANGTFTYEGCWTVTGPSGSKYDRTLNNESWREWVHSADCRSQMISHSSYYNNSHYATGLGYCGESNAWNKRGNVWVQTLNRCDSYLNAADIAGVAWQDINFQTQRALYTILSCSGDSDWRNPTTYSGDAREYCARVFATVGYTGFKVWYDNGQLQAHLSQVDTVRPFVDAVINHTSLIEEDIQAAPETMYLP